MSDEVKERLMGNYDGHRRLCSTYHKGIPMPRIPRSVNRKPMPPIVEMHSERAKSVRPSFVDISLSPFNRSMQDEDP
jgi:hypothetical protein